MTNYNKGLLYNTYAALLWALFPIISIASFSNINPIFSAGISTFFASIFFTFWLIKKKKVNELKNKEGWKYLLLTAFTIGVLFYGLVFYGMSMTTAGNSSIILLMEVFFSFVILNIWKKEQSTIPHIIGAILMLAGCLLILFPGKIDFNFGDLIILFASAIPPIGNHYQRMARKHVSSTTIMFVRSVIGSISFIIIASFFYSAPSLVDINTAILPLLFNGLFIMGLSKLFWVEAIHRIPITVAAAFGTISPLFTLGFAYMFLGDIPTIWQLYSIIPMIAGVYLLARK